MGQRISRRALMKSCAIATSLAAAPPLALGAESRPMTYKLVREIPVEEGYDLVVAGGGPAGAAAAICAARLGAKVLLAEATGCLGGMGTSGLVTRFAYAADGEKMLSAGLLREICGILQERGFLKPGATRSNWEKGGAAYQPEGYKLVLDELAFKAGVEVRFFTRVIDADVDRKSGTVHGVVLHNIEGYHYIRARKFIDGTGDAALAALCGVACREAGRDTPKPMAPSLCSMVSNVDWKRFKNQQEAVLQAVKDAFFTVPDTHVPGLFQTSETTGSMNAPHIFNLNALRCKSLSDGLMMGRKLAQEYIAFYRKYVPGCEKLEHVTTAALLGIRESRRIMGEYELNANDFMARRQFPDQIAVWHGAIDIHVHDASREDYKRYYDEFHTTGRMKKGECIGIPYGVLVPKGWKNLWVAGRPVSADIQVHGGIRVQSAAVTMGQAAGTAAVQSIKTRRIADELDIEQLVTTLRQAGAYLPQTKTSKVMTRTT